MFTCVCDLLDLLLSDGLVFVIFCCILCFMFWVCDRVVLFTVSLLVLWFCGCFSVWVGLVFVYFAVLELVCFGWCVVVAGFDCVVYNWWFLRFVCSFGVCFACLFFVCCLVI